MARAAKCDRCGQFFDLYEVNRKDSVTVAKGFNTLTQGAWNPTDGYFGKKTYELCADCRIKLDEWLEEAEG